MAMTFVADSLQQAPMYVSPHRLRLAVRILRGGGLIAHPTEGVWGLACDPLQPRAVLRLLAAKRRDPDKGLILVAADTRALAPYIAPVSDDVHSRAESSWPGPVTWLMPASPSVPWWLRGVHAKIAVRVTAHPLAALLCQAYGGALVSTSANISARPAARNAAQVRAQLRERVAMVLAGALQTPGRPSTIRDAVTGEVVRG